MTSRKGVSRKSPETREQSCNFAELKVRGQWWVEKFFLFFFLKKPLEYMTTMSNVVNLHVLRDLREVLRFWRDCSVELCHWDAPGCNLGPKHGCRVNDGGRTNLHSTPGGAVTPWTKLVRLQIHGCLHHCASCPPPLELCAQEGRRSVRAEVIYSPLGMLITGIFHHCQCSIFVQILIHTLIDTTFNLAFKEKS